MATVQTQNLEPVPSQTPMLESDPKLITPTWMRWFTNMRAKINVINASIVALAGNSGAGFLSSNGTGTIASRTLVPGSGITITNPDGVAGDPVISATASGGAPLQITTVSGDYTITPAAVPSTSSSIGWIEQTLTTTNTITIDTNANQNCPVGSHIFIREHTAATTTIKGVSGVSLTGPTIVDGGNYSVGQVVQVAIDSWAVFGNIVWANFATTTLNPANTAANITLSGGNLIATTTSSGLGGSPGVVGRASGKFYFEATLNTSTFAESMGVYLSTDTPTSNEPGNAGGGYGYDQRGYLFHSSSYTAGWPTYTSGDIIGCAIDITGNKIWWSKNGTWISGNPSTGTSPSFTTAAGTYYPGIGFFQTPSKWTVNFGASGFTYSIPTGFVTWS